MFIEADKIRLYQVITNLLNNAIKFTQEGIVSVDTYIKDNNEAVVRIEDNGIGIHPEIFPRLFTKFATRSDTGTGVGLFISKSIVEAHGGKIGLKITLMEEALPFILPYQLLLQISISG